MIEKKKKENSTLRLVQKSQLERTTISSQHNNFNFHQKQIYNIGIFLQKLFNCGIIIKYLNLIQLSSGIVILLNFKSL